MRDRSWIRPKWYVIRVGQNWVGAAPYPDNVAVVPDDEPDSVCTVCGVACPNGGYDLPVGFMCLEHGAQWWQDHPVSRWQQLAWRLDAPFDRLYWWYCERFGQRVYR